MEGSDRQLFRHVTSVILRFHGTECRDIDLYLCSAHNNG
jgi:hypothetical protein